MNLPSTLRELTDSAGFDSFQADRLGNQLFIDDPDRADRIHNAAENGADGSTHAEALQDMRDYLEQAHREALRQIWDDTTEAQEAALDATRDRIAAEIDAAEAYHEKAGTLHQEIG